MKKSSLYRTVLLFLIILMGIQNSFALTSSIINDEPFDRLKTSQTTPLIIGVNMGPVSIDPHDSWDHASFNVIEQVCEGLFAYNLSHPDKEIIPRLASDYGTWSIDGLNYTVPLRQKIIFHDGTPFNASVVKWNFDRLAYLMNATGELPVSGQVALIDSVYRWIDRTPFINRVEEINTYTIKFVLNRPFGGFEGLLCFTGSYMVSPLSTPFSTYLDKNSEQLIGTGPFVFNELNEDVNVTFHSFENYWRTNATITTLILKIIQDQYSLHKALIDGEIDMLLNPNPNYFDNISNSANLNLTESEKGSWVIFYLGINNHLIDRPFREAISYALNYSHIIDKLRGGLVERLKSPIPKSMVYSNYSFNVPIYNLSEAREIMQSMGYGIGWDITPGGIHEINWTTANFRTLNYTYNEGSKFREELGNLTKANLEKIGIKVEIHADLWLEFFFKLLGINEYSQDMLELFFIGWGADYNDPSQFINVLLSNSSYDTNSAQYNGGFGGFTPYSEENDVELLMEQAMTTIDKDERKTLYDKIQQLIIERDFPWVFGFTPKTYIAYHKDIEGIEENAFISVDEDGASSLKGNFQLLSWPYTPGDGGGEIPGYQVIFISAATLISIIYIIHSRILKSKK